MSSQPVLAGLAGIPQVVADRQGDTWVIAASGLQPEWVVVFDASIDGRGVIAEYVSPPVGANSLSQTIIFPARAGSRTVEVGVVDPTTRDLKFTLAWITDSEVLPPKRLPWTPPEPKVDAQGITDSDNLGNESMLLADSLRTVGDSTAPNVIADDSIRHDLRKFLETPTPHLPEHSSSDVDRLSGYLAGLAAAADDIEGFERDHSELATRISMIEDPYQREVLSALLGVKAFELRLLSERLSSAIGEAHDLVAKHYTPITTPIDVTQLNVIEGHRQAVGVLPLPGSMGEIRLVAPQASAASSTLREEQRWTTPPELIASPDHGFAKSNATIDSSIVDWRTRKIESFGVSSVSGDGRVLAGTVSNDGFSQPILFDLTTGEPRQIGVRFRGSTDIAVSSDGSRAATVTVGTGRNGTLRLWNAATRQQIGETQHPEYVTQVAFRPSTTDLLYATEHGQYVDWQTEDGGGARIFDQVYPRFAVSHAIAAAPRLENLGRGRVAPGSVIEIYDFSQQRRISPIDTGSSVKGIALSPNGSTILTWHEGGFISIFDVASRTKLSTISPTPGTRDLKVEFSDAGKAFIVTDNKGVLREFLTASVREGGTEPLFQRSYSTRETIIAHPNAPGYLSARTDSGRGLITASELPTFVSNGTLVPAVEAKADGTLWVDFSDVNHAVTATQFRIVGAPAATAFLVTSFAGQTRLESQIVKVGDSVTVAQDSGISAIAIQGVNWKGAIGIAEFNVTTITAAKTVDSKPLGFFSNELYAQTWANHSEQWNDKSLDWRMGPYAIEGSPDQFTLVRAVGGKLNGFVYHTNVRWDGAGNAKSLARARLPDDFMIRLDDSTIILLPGRPRFLYADVGDGTVVGTRNGQNGGIILEKRQSPDILDLVPVNDFDLTLTFLDATLANGDAREGFFRETITPGVVSHRSPVGGAIDSVIRIFNRGNQSGEITAQVLVSSDLRPIPVVQKSFTTSIAASDILTFRFRAELPEHEKSANVLVRIFGPDGTVLAEEAAGRVGRNAEVSEVLIAKKKDDIAAAQSVAVTETVRYWITLGQNPAYAGVALAGLQETLSAAERMLGQVPRPSANNEPQAIEEANESLAFPQDDGGSASERTADGFVTSIEYVAVSNQSNIFHPASGIVSYTNGTGYTLRVFDRTLLITGPRGSEGCGTDLIGLAVPDQILDVDLTTACIVHDKNWTGDITLIDRLKANAVFFAQIILDNSQTPDQFRHSFRVATVYTSGVTLGAVYFETKEALELFLHRIRGEGTRP